MTKIVLGVCGYKNSGKDTFFKVINKYYPQATQYSLAAKLKNACSKVFEIPLNNFNDHDLKEKELENFIFLTEDNITQVLTEFGLAYNYDDHVRPHIAEVITTPRKLAQYIGTEVLRSFDKDLHVRFLCDSFKDEEIIIITDVRYPNELKYLKNKYKNKFFSIYIDNYSAAIKAASDNHSSEKNIKKIAKECIKISNNESFINFEKQSLLKFESLIILHNIDIKRG